MHTIQPPPTAPDDDLAAARARVAELEAQLQTERRRADHLASLNEIGRLIGATLDQSDLLEQVVALIHRRLGFDRVLVLLAEAGDVVVRAAAGWADPRAVLGLRLRRGEGIDGVVAETGQPLLVNDVRREARYIAQPAGEPSRAELAVPIRLGRRVIGVLDVQSGRPDAFAEYDQATLEILADHLAVALENVRAYRALDRRLAEVVALQKVGTALMAELDTARMLETIAEQARELVGAETLALQVYVPGEPDGELAYATGLRAELMRGSRVPWDRSLAGEVLRSGQAIVSNDAPNDPRSDKATIERANTRNVLLAPMMAPSGPVGIISATNKTSGNFTERDVELLTLFGGQAAVALDNARTYRAMAQHVAEVVALQEVMTALFAQRDARQVMETIAEQARRLLGCETVALELLAEGRDWLETAVASGVHASRLKQIRLPLDASLSGVVLREGRVIITEHAAADARTHKETVTAADCHSLLVAPMGAEGRRVGTISAFNKLSGGFSERDAELMAIFGGQAAVAIENARLIEAERRRTRQAEALARASVTINSSLDLQRTLDVIARQVCEVLDAANAAIFLHAPETDTVTVSATSGTSERLRRLAGQPFRRDNSKSFRETSAGLTLVVPAAQTEPGFTPATVAAFGAHSLMSTPLRAKGRYLGYLYVDQGREPRDWTDDDRQLFESLAGPVATAVENARLLEAERRRTRQAEALAHASVTINSSLDLQHTLDVIVRQVREATQAEHAAVFLYDPEEDTVAGSAVTDLPAEQLAGFKRLRLGRYGSQPFRETWSGRTFVAPDTGHETDSGGGRGIFAVQSLMATPLQVKGRYLGFLAIDQGDRLRRWSADDVLLFESLAGPVATAVENARLLEAERRRTRQAEALAHASLVVNSSLDLTQTLEAIVSQVREALEVQRAAVFLYEPEQDTVRGAAVAGLPPELRPAFNQIHFTREQTKSYRETWEGRTCVVYDIVSEGGFDERVRRTFRMRSLLAAPLQVQGRYLGYLYVDQGDERREWSDSEVQLFVSLAGPVATAVENARLHDEARRGAAVEERTRLARELHDSVTQSLFSASMLAQAAQSLWKRDADKAKERLDRAAELCGGALAEMRALIFELRPDALAEEGLASALRKHAAAREARDGIRVEVVAEAERRLPPACEEAAYRIVREALHNVAKHAGAARVVVRLGFAPDVLVIEVRDDGRGFDAAEQAGKGLGLTSMRERAEQLGGRLELTSAPGAGTAVRATIPIPCD